MAISPKNKAARTSKLPTSENDTREPISSVVNLPMISQKDVANANQGSNSESDSMRPVVDLRSSISQLSFLLKRAQTFEQLRADVSEMLNALPQVVAVFYLELNEDGLDFNLLRSVNDGVADNVEQWAANTGVACCTTGETRLEQSQDASSGSVFEMIAVPIAGRKLDSALVALFSGNGDNENNLVLMESAAHCLAQWESNQQMMIVTQAAEDLAAQDQLVATVEGASSLESASQLLAKELSGYIEILNHSTPSANSPDDSLKNPHIEAQSNISVDVYIGLINDNGPLKLNAVSNSNTLPASEEKAAIEAAMQECLCRKSVSVWPRSDDNPAGVLCLKRMSKIVRASHLVACPIECSSENGDAIGVVLFATQQPLSARCFAFADSCAARMGSSLQLLKRAEPGRFQSLFDKISDIKNNRKKLSLISFLVVATSLIPMPYQVSSECEVRPASKLFIASPFDTTLEKCHVQPGQQVTKDMALATLDGRETRLELAEIEAELNRAMKQRDGHVVSHESGEAYVAKYEIERLQSRRDLLLHRQESLEIRSPLDGIVIAGDLKNAEGMPLKVGETLFEVAPLNKLRVELAIPEDDVRYTEPEMPTQIRLDAFPFESWNGNIERIHPASELKNDQNVFVAVVQIDNSDGRLRPGMTGYAKTKTIWRPVIWNYFHRPAAAAARWLGW